MRKTLSRCLGLSDNGQYTSTNRLQLQCVDREVCYEFGTSEGLAEALKSALVIFECQSLCGMRTPQAIPKEYQVLEGHAHNPYPRMKFIEGISLC